MHDPMNVKFNAVGTGSVLSGTKAAGIMRLNTHPKYYRG